MNPTDHLDIAERVLRWARDYPWRWAMIETGEPVSYKEFGKRVEMIGASLASHAGETAFISARKSSWCYATMVAALQWAVPYMLVDPGQASQAKRAFDALQPTLAIGAATDLERIIPQHAPVHRITYESMRASGRRLDPDVLDQDTAYWMLTSGSTGEPKLIRLGASGLANLLTWAEESDLVQPDDRAAQYSRLTFDLSVLEVLGPLRAGATLVPASSPADLTRPLRFLQKYDISWWCSVPAVADMLARDRSGKPSGVRSTFVFCGDQLMPRHLSSVWQRFPNARIVNTYGPTEATVLVTAMDVPSQFVSLGGAVPIGRPIDGVSLHFRKPEVSDGDDVHVTEVGIEGEQVAIQILQSRDGRFESMGPDRLGNSRIFWTGDAVRDSPEGLRFDRRIDRQVKLNGFRIELSAIDAAVQRIIGVPSFTVLNRGRLVCAVPSLDLNSSELKARLKHELPEYMVPSRFVRIDGVPTTLNGKIDWPSLRRLVEQPEDRGKSESGAK